MVQGDSRTSFPTGLQGPPLPCPSPAPPGGAEPLSSPSPIQVPLDNHIPERAGPGSRVPSEPKELEENEVIPKRLSPPVEGVEEISNRVSMSSTAQGSSIFERTEVLAGKAPAPPWVPRRGVLHER